MNKKFWSVFLAVISAVALLSMAAVGVITGISIDAVESAEPSAENILGAFIAVFAAWLGFFIAVIILAAIGFAASLVEELPSGAGQNMFGFWKSRLTDILIDAVKADLKI